MRKTAILLAVLFLAAGVSAEEQVAQIEARGFARETPPGSSMSAAYLQLHNGGEIARQLLKVAIPRREGALALLHTTAQEAGVSRMRPLDQLSLPAGATVHMAPGGVHLMLHGVHLAAGEQLLLRLYFADGEVVDLRVPVQGLQANAAGHRHGG